MKTNQVDLVKSQSQWPIRIKILRAVWTIFRPLFWSGTPRFLNPLRVFALVLFGARLGKAVLIMDGVRVWMPWNLTVGDYSAIGRGVELYNFAPIVVGSNTVISQYSFLCTATHEYSHPHMPLIWRKIAVGSSCWVAASAFIGPGVTIGDGAVIGARSVVTKDVAPWTVCAGNPSKYIKDRVLAKQ